MIKGLVFGTGFIGTRIAEHKGYKTISRRYTNVLQLRDLENFLENKKLEVVINAIGATGRPNIDWCEDNKKETLESNVMAAQNLGLVCAKNNIYFVHLGSGCIYYGDNNGKGFSEDDELNFYGPQFYAKTKILAEKFLKEIPSLILRVRMPIDDRPHERNLINKLSKYSKVIDAQNSMTTVPHMLLAVDKLIERKKLGIYNLVNPGTISAYEIMVMYKELVNPKHEFEKFSISELDKKTKGKRSNCYLNSDKLISEGIKMPEIHQAVEECLEKYKDYIQR